MSDARFVILYFGITWLHNRRIRPRVRHKCGTFRRCIRAATGREFPWDCWPTKGDEDARGARTHACRVHTRVNAWDSVAKGVRKSANTARMSACATGGSRRINISGQASSTERYHECR
jgi:hypothetical protein